MPGEIDYAALLTELGSNKFTALRPAQAEALETYRRSYTDEADIALELPTGAGKSLIALLICEAWRREGRGVALATVVETWGSAPRPVGSNLVIDDQGNFLGSVSGGCVEGAVVTEAIDVIEAGKPKMLEFGVADETAWNVGLSCGGTIRVFVEKVE